MKENIIRDKSFQLSFDAIKLYKILLKNNEYVLSKQFLRSATSIGANIEEATAAYSKRDFTAKMSIASKEARESLYWLRLIEASDFVQCDLSAIKSDINEIINILTSIVKTSQLALKLMLNGCIVNEMVYVEC